MKAWKLSQSLLHRAHLSLLLKTAARITNPSNVASKIESLLIGQIAGKNFQQFSATFAEQSEFLRT